MTSRDDLHTCLARGCSTEVLERFLMCKDHWYKVPLSLKNEFYEAYRNSPTVMSPEREFAALRAMHAVGLREDTYTLEYVRNTEEKARKALFPHTKKALRHGFSKAQYKVLCRLSEMYDSEEFSSYEDLSTHLSEWKRTLQNVCQYLIVRGYVERADNDITNERIRLTEAGSKLVHGLKKRDEDGTLILGM